jgi:hypothetical protein
MAVNLSPIGNAQQFFDNTGVPLNGGLLYTYQAGSTTPLATYTDINATVANANPIVLDASGRLANEVWLTYGVNYKFVLKNSAGSTIGTYDNIYGIVGVQTAVGTTIPLGVITLWYGSIGSVPTGWYLCDGANGTPDLRDKFIVAAGSTYAVGATGGTANSIVVSHDHTYSSTTGSAGSASGTILARVGSDFGAFQSDSGTGVFAASGSSLPNRMQGAAGTGSNSSVTMTIPTHTHTVSGTTTTAGVSGTNANLPPYYALAYIMKS